MPSLSSKGILMPESPIRKLAPYAEKAKLNGLKVYHLNIGQPDIKSPKIAIDAVKNIELDVLAYSKSEGNLELRQKVKNYYNSFDINITTNEIIISTGASEALSFAMASIMDKGDELIIPEPFYANYNGFATANGINVIPVHSNLSENFALPQIHEFEKLISSKTKAILICNPNNPTGYVYSEAEIKILVKIVKKHNLFLIADEVYREFVYDGCKHTSILKFQEIKENSIVIDSFSKRYSMCGARIGCVISKNKLFMSTVIKFAQARLSPPTFAQIACTAALDVEKKYFESVIKDYNSRRLLLIDELKKIPGVKVSVPKGAFYCIAELPVSNAEAFCKWMLETFNKNGKTVMLAPASGFYSTKNCGLNQVRIAYVLNNRDLIDAIGLIKDGLTEYLEK